VLNEQRQPLQATFSNDRKGFGSLNNYLSKRVAKGSKVCLEATGIYGDEVAAYLYGRGYAVCVVNPLRVKRYAESQLRRNKTDKLDAQIIADFCRTQEAEPWTPPSAAWLELRALARRREDLVEMRVQEKQRVHTSSSPSVQADLQAHIAYLDEQIARLDEQIQQHIDQHPDLRQQQDLLNSIPGIANRTSSRLLAEVRDIRAFATVEQLVAYVGLNPRLCQSGKYQGEVKISKLGNAALRAALYLPARSAKQHNPLVQGLVQRMQAQGHRANAITVAVMRKLLHFVYGVLKSGRPFDPNYLAKSALTP
jgi:transposase